VPDEYLGTAELKPWTAMWRNAKDFPKALSVSAAVSGLIIVLVAIFGTAPIVLQAASAGHLSQNQISSWFFTMMAGSGLYGIYMSLRLRMPTTGAWSTPSTALLVTAISAHKLSDVVGAYIIASVLIILIGSFGWLEKILASVPRPVTMAMLGGILFNFGVNIFPAISKEPLIVLVMIATFFIGRRFGLRAPIISSFVLGLIVAAISGRAHQPHLHIKIASIVWVNPTFSFSALITLAIPLLLLILTSQYAPGMAVMTGNGYKAPTNKALVTGGIISLVSAPMLNAGNNSAAISAAIGATPQAEPDKTRRYTASTTSGILYIAVGVLGTTYLGLLNSIPSAMLAALAGLALLPAIASSTHEALVDNQYREAALVTLLITVSNIHFFKIGAPFWGLVGGVVAHQIVEYRNKKVNA
jgi:benzoate membrane transport protein